MTTSSLPALGATSAPPSRRALRVGLWVAQVLLALAFGMAGFMKTTMPIAELGKQLPWVPDVPAALVRFIGTAELLGAIGLILPSATRIKPSLTGLAGAALAVNMFLASMFHLSRGEAFVLPINLSLGALAAFVAWGRYTGAPIPPRV
jgi:putative oxidoreductase